MTKPIETICIDKISFHYTPGKKVFDDFSYNLHTGKSYALVGPSGAGKSTLANILLGFYEVDGGSVKLNSVEISQINRISLRKKILLLSQKTVAFNDTIFNNITFGIEATEEEVWQSLELVELKETINQLPEKLSTVLQYQGTNLSGGQLQRIGIARALLRRPDVVIFDESFSGLDSVTKFKVLANIKQFGKDKILIFITHDQEIVAWVDEIVNLGDKSHDI